MTLPLQRVAVQRVLNTVPKRANVVPGTFASALAQVQPHPAAPSQGRGSSSLGNVVPQPSSATGSTSKGLSGGSRGAQRPLVSGPSGPGASSLVSGAPVATAAPGAVPYQSQIEAAAKKYNLDPALLAAVAKTESNFNAHAQSGVGAKGLMQLMDSTARGLGVGDSFDPTQSLDGGARFLSGLLKQFKGDVRLALAAYNAGPAAVQKYGGIPPYQETQRYVPKVLAQVDTFRRIWADHSPATENS